MKTIQFVFFALVSICLGSCSSDDGLHEHPEVCPNTSQISCKAVFSSTHMNPQQEILVFDGSQIEWFNETTGELHFNPNNSGSPIDLSLLKQYNHVKILIGGKEVFTLACTVTSEETQIINEPVLYYDSNVKKFYIEKQLLSHTEMVRIHSDFYTQVEKNWQNIQPGWKNFITQLKKEDKYRNANSSVLMIKVDYTTNIFEGGVELTFPIYTKTFTITNDFKQPGDFGSIQLFYAELNEPLFYGEIIWMGSGKILYPTTWLAADQFKITVTDDLVFSHNGFENVFPVFFNQEISEGQSAWVAAQSVIKVREYIASNPEQKVKFFLYTPSVGAGDPKQWKWIFLLKD